MTEADAAGGDAMPCPGRFMLFNSYAFILIFLPITVIGFFAIGRWHSHRLAKLWLTLASYAFYAYWNPLYLPLLLASVGANFYLGQAISAAPRQGARARLLLTLGITTNLALIAYYKYAGFFVETVNSASGLDYAIPNIILPLGISFYTFTQIAYLVDAYREDLRHYDFLTYNLFISFYPQLIAGPLLLHTELMPQLRSPALFRFSYDDFVVGLIWFTLGLAKKVLLADEVGTLAAPYFEHPERASFFGAWFGALAYTLQLYFDFSGYSDMAIGLARMFGVQLPMNFDSPYKARSIIDFWRRWHMTLSRFLRSYLYVALGGNRNGKLRRYLNLMITMLLGGLWHGAGWNFVIWGGLHGIYLMVNHAWRQLGWTMPRALAWAITLLCVIVGWVFFRAHSAGDALELLGAMSGTKGFELPMVWAPLLPDLSALGVQWHFDEHLPGWKNQGVIFGLLAIALFMPNTQQLMSRFQATPRWAIASGILAALGLLSLNQVSEFLYFQF